MTGKADLAMLGELARLRVERSGARLARMQSLIDTLEGQVNDLRQGGPAAPASIAEAVMRDRWHRWRAQQIRLLNSQIARLNAAAQPQRETYARDTARNAVLEKLRNAR